jgi:hypothetical protein
MIFLLIRYRMQLWTKMASQQAPGSNAFNLATHAPHSYSPSHSTHSSPSLSPALSHHTHSHHTPSPILQTISPALPSASPPSQVAPGPHLLSRTPPPLISSPSPFTNMALPGSGSSSSSSSSGGSGNNSPEWHYHHNNSPPALYGLASNLRPSFFQASQKPLGSGSASGSGSGSGNGSLSSLLSGKFGGRYNSHNHLGSHHSSSMNALSNSISNLSLSPKDSSASSSSARAADKAKDAETAVIATLASQTLLKRLGGAFWDAFSGHTTPGASTAATIAGGSGGPSSSVKTVDQEKVRKVLEGRAVVKVVDVEPAAQSPPQPASRAPADCGALLEESFKSLTLGKK